MFSKCAFKEAPENYINNFPTAGVLWLMLLPFSIAKFWNEYLKKPLRNGDLNVSINCWVREVCQKMYTGNFIKSLSVRRVDCIVDWNSFSGEKTALLLHNLLRQNSTDRLTYLYITDGMANTEVWDEKKKSGIWLLQAVDTEKNGKRRFYLKHEPQKNCTC